MTLLIKVDTSVKYLSKVYADLKNQNGLHLMVFSSKIEMDQ